MMGKSLTVMLFYIVNLVLSSFSNIFWDDLIEILWSTSVWNKMIYIWNIANWNKIISLKF